MNHRVELFLKKTILPELEQGRPGWDKPHTESVVLYVKKIIRSVPQLNLDLDSLIIVGYAHDWGYSKLFKGGFYVGMEEIKKVKSLHAKISAEKIGNLLESSEFNFLKPKQKERIHHLVLVHDNLEKLRHNDELIFMEADTLGQLDITQTAPSFNKVDNEKYMRRVEQTRIPKFITQFSKKRVAKLFKLRQEYYKNLPAL